MCKTKKLCYLSHVLQLRSWYLKNRPSQGATERHVRHCQPPLPPFVGLNIHTETRSRKMVNTPLAPFYNGSTHYNRCISKFSCIYHPLHNDVALMGLHYHIWWYDSKGFTKANSKQDTEGIGNLMIGLVGRYCCWCIKCNLHFSNTMKSTW